MTSFVLKLVQNCNIEPIKVLNVIISQPISIKVIIRGPNGGLILVILGAQRGEKFKKLFETKSKLSYKLKLIVSKLF